jgi:hypothetical protein
MTGRPSIPPERLLRGLQQQIFYLIRREALLVVARGQGRPHGPADQRHQLSAEVQGARGGERLGEPVAWREIDERGVQWLYPEVGLTLLTSSDDGAVFEYVPPRDFVMPSDVTLAEP